MFTETLSELISYLDFDMDFLDNPEIDSFCEEHYLFSVSFLLHHIHKSVPPNLNNNLKKED